jgi:hypothetical protein
MTIAIDDSRATFIWFESFRGLLADPPVETKRPYLLTPEGYADAFTASVSGTPNGPVGVTPPWPRKGSHMFWAHYLGGQRDLARVKGAAAWNALVPFRVRVPVGTNVPFAGTMSIEGFLYPHGHALVITVRLAAQGLNLDDTVDALVGIRGGKPVELDALARKGLEWLRSSTFGADAKPDTVTETPYSVQTFIRSEGANGVNPIVEGDPIHRALQACTSWSPTWKVDALQPLAPRLAGINLPAPPGHAMYVDKHGQSAWFPETSNVAGGAAQRSLSCYHRNQVFGALQVESLSALMDVTAGVLANGAALSLRHDNCARRGADTLGRMYGAQKTYKSGSIRAHIERRGLAGVTNDVRARYGRPALF